MPKQAKKNVREAQLRYLDTQARMGITKHIGGPEATETLIRLCRVRRGEYVLDVGCGTGRTASLLARDYGCRVAAVDVSPRMVEWARERMREDGVEGKVELVVADAEKLPFKNSVFDAVLCESVLAFVPGKMKALGKFARVLKKGGFVGLNESTWAKTPVPKKVQEYYQSVDGVDFRTQEGGRRRLMRRVWRS